MGRLLTHGNTSAIRLGPRPIGFHSGQSGNTTMLKRTSSRTGIAIMTRWLVDTSNLNRSWRRAGYRHEREPWLQETRPPTHILATTIWKQLIPAEPLSYRVAALGRRQRPNN